MVNLNIFESKEKRQEREAREVALTRNLQDMLVDVVGKAAVEAANEELAIIERPLYDPRELRPSPPSFIKPIRSLDGEQVGQALAVVNLATTELEIEMVNSPSELPMAPEDIDIERKHANIIERMLDNLTGVGQQTQASIELLALTHAEDMRLRREQFDLENEAAVAEFQRADSVLQEKARQNDRVTRAYRSSLEVIDGQDVIAAPAPQEQIEPPPANVAHIGSKRGPRIKAEEMVPDQSAANGESN